MDLKSKVRNEIEQLIKENNINRNRFFEVSKLQYQDVINKVFSKFVNRIKRNDFNLNRAYLRYNPKLECKGISGKTSSEWWQWFRLLLELISDQMKPIYLIFSGETYTWVYEGICKK